MDGATSDARCEWQQVEARLLAEYRTSQRVPMQFTAPSKHPRRPVDHPIPPRRRGKPKTNLEASVRKDVYWVSHVKAISGESRRSNMLYKTWKWRRGVLYYVGTRYE